MNNIKTFSSSLLYAPPKCTGSFKYSIHKYSTASPNVLSFKQYGSPEKVITLERKTTSPKLDKNSVRVSMKAAPINPIDIAIIEGKYPIKKSFPMVGGVEGVGVISEISGSSKQLKVGDWVIPRRPGSFGTWSEEVIVHEQDLLVIPQTIPFEYAACLSVAPTTAYLLMKKFANLKEGDVIIQNGANGMVGQTIFQLAAMKGIKSINIIRHREVREYGELVERMKYYGAHLVVPENYLNTPDYHQLVSDLPRPSVAFDCIGGQSATEMARLLKEGGTLVSYSSYNHGYGVTLPSSSFIFNDLNVRGFWLERWINTASDEERSNIIKELASLISSSQLRLWLETYHVSEHPFAFPRMEQKKDRKILFTF